MAKSVGSVPPTKNNSLPLTTARDPTKTSLISSAKVAASASPDSGSLFPSTIKIGTLPGRAPTTALRINSNVSPAAVIVVPGWTKSVAVEPSGAASGMTNRRPVSNSNVVTAPTASAICSN